MFKIDGLNLPDIKAAEPEAKKKGSQGKKNDNKPSADHLQGLFSELGRAPSGKAKQAKPDGEQQAPEPKKQDRNIQERAPREPKKNKRNNKKRASSAVEKEDNAADAKTSTTSHASETHRESKKPKLTPMQLKMQAKLSGSRFRWINEQLYTTDSGTALDLFKSQPQLFGEYHQGFRHQVESWPENPVESMVASFKTRLEKPLNAPGGLPASSANGEIVVADMGCGEAELSRALAKTKGSRKSRKAHFKIHSFDLHKANDRITVADISNVPLPDKSCDVVVYCLALMGTNTKDFLKEGLRILKPRGELWIAEIKSRFDEGDATKYSRFVSLLKSMGLHHKHTDDSNKMFVKFEFQLLPGSNTDRKKPKFIDDSSESADKSPLLKPCIYKRR